MIFQVEIRQIDGNNNNPNNSGLGSALMFLGVLFFLFIVLGPELEPMLESEPPAETSTRSIIEETISKTANQEMVPNLSAEQKIKFERLLELEHKRGGMRLDQNEIDRLAAGDYAVEQAYQNYRKMKRRGETL